MSNNNEFNPIYFCYSRNQHRFLRDNGLDTVGVGINENSGRKFWQYVRGAELDRLLTQWSNNRPK